MTTEKPKAPEDAGGHEARDLAEAPSPPPSLRTRIRVAWKVGGLASLGLGGLLLLGGLGQLARGIPPPGPLLEGLFFLGVATVGFWIAITWLVGLLMVFDEGWRALGGGAPGLPDEPAEDVRRGADD